MPSAREIALRAHEIARCAREERERQQERERNEEERRVREHRDELVRAATEGPLAEWFPGVHWHIWDEVGTVVVLRSDDASDDAVEVGVERTPIERAGAPKYDPGWAMDPAKWRPCITMGSVQTDTATQYPYWSGTEVKSAADVGDVLVRREAVR